MQAGAGLSHLNSVTLGLRSIWVVGEASSPVQARGQTKVPPESADEYFMALEAARQSNVEDRTAGGEQESSRGFETEAEGELLGRFAGESRESAMEMRRRRLGQCGKRGQLGIAVAMGGGKGKHGLESSELIPHMGMRVSGSGRGLLDVSCFFWGA